MQDSLTSSFRCGETFDTAPYSGLHVSDDSGHSDHSDYSDDSDHSDYSDHSDDSDHSDYSSPLISKFPNLHVGISKSSRGEETFST